MCLITCGLLVSGCGGDDNNAATSSHSQFSIASSSSSAVMNNSPVISLPESLDWQENTLFSQEVTATGVEPLRYLLVQSPDANIFSINETTGMLVANTAFDFELPQDANHDNTYELSIMVIGSGTRSAQATLFIHVVNVAEYTLAIDFPIEGANIGGHASSIFMRGHILKEGLQDTAPSDTLTITANNHIATFSETEPSYWTIEIPLQPNSNTLDVSLSQFENTLDFRSLQLDNSAVPMLRGETSTGITGIYSIEMGGSALLKTEPNSTEYHEELNISMLSDDSICRSFRRAELVPNSTQLLIECDTSSVDKPIEFLIYDAADQSTHAITPEFKPNVDTRYLWLENDFLLFNTRTDRFSLINLQTNEQQSFSIADEDEISNFENTFFAAGLDLYIYSRYSAWQHVDLETVISDNVSNVVTQDADSITGRPLDVIQTDGLAYMIDDLAIQVIDLSTLSSQTLSLTAEIEPFTHSSAFLYADNAHVVLKNKLGTEIYSLDTKSGELALVDIPQPLTEIFVPTGIVINSNDSRLAYYESDTNTFGVVDLDTLELLDTRVLDNPIYDQNPYRYIAFDWHNSILYNSNILNWGGIDSESEDSLIDRFMINTNTAETLLRAYDLNTFFDGAYTQYRVTNITLTEDSNYLWFSLLALPENNSDGIEGVYSINVTSGEIDTVYEIPRYGHIFDDDSPFLSQFHTGIDGVILTEWNSGYVQTLSVNGAIQRYVEDGAPYVTTSGAGINNATGMLYYAGYFIDESQTNETPDFNSVEINAIDLLSKEQRLVSSNTFGNGPPLGQLTYHLNEKNDLLYSATNGRILIIDTLTGDRVLTSISH